MEVTKVYTHIQRKGREDRTPNLETFGGKASALGGHSEKRFPAEKSEGLKIKGKVVADGEA